MTYSKHTPKVARGFTRRDFLNSVMIGSGALLAAPHYSIGSDSGSTTLPAPVLGDEWYGYGGIGDYQPSHGNTPEAVERAHALRDASILNEPHTVSETDEVYDLVIVGGGMAGLGGALRFTQRRGDKQSLLILDNHPVLGGEAKRNIFEINGQRLVAPQGANGFSVPAIDDGGFADGDARYFEELDIPREYSYPTLQGSEKQLRFGQDDYGFLYWLEDQVSVGYFVDQRSHGVSPRWVRNPWQTGLQQMPMSDYLRNEHIRWRNWSTKVYGGAEYKRWLDSITYRELVVEHMGIDPKVVDHVDPILASGAGGTSDVLSAYSAYALGMPGTTAFYQEPFQLGERHSFPGGNDGFTRYFLKHIKPEALSGGSEFADIVNANIQFSELDKPGQPVRIRLGASVMKVAHRGPADEAGYVDIVYARDRELHRVKAKAILMATGAWITKYVVSDLPETHSNAMNEFVHTAFLVANVALTNWRFIERAGVTGFRWWDDIGFAANLKRPMHVGNYQPPFHPDKPATLSFYIPLYYPGKSAIEQGILGRTELLNTPYAAYEMRLRNLLKRLFSRHGFREERDMAGLILNRWGHAYTVPRPGFYFGKDGNLPPHEVIRQRHGRITFAHSELRGNQHWGPAAAEGARGVDQLFDAGIW
ncbi:NAD(P)-binding protein [Pseudohaliea sp.]|uniref:NAD(P)-binding protein n=1 Tax=Pseudohaliea sp. TaxID=2740289 RepID=UPI0032EE6362